MDAKRQKIKEVYYKYFDKEDVDSLFHISVNGIISRENLELINDDLFLKHFHISEHYCWPIELNGIEDNNGWTKIESEEDLPKQGGDYWIFNEAGIQVGVYYLEGSFWEDEFCEYRIQVTHYQPIIKPKPPIY